MTTPLPRSSPGVGRLTGLVLGLVVFVCVTLIGCAGYLKYQLDRAETILVTPEHDLSDEAEVTEKLRRNLGYGGFIGSAQNYITTRDPGSLSDMRLSIKVADDLITQLPDKASGEDRHDLVSIVNLYDNVMQKANKASADTAATFTSNDLMPLYASLSVLDSRLTSVTANNKTEAHTQLQFWAMLLTLISWCSLIIAAAMSVGIYLSLRDRNSAPLRALAQSIRNMASGDMRTSIWGMERSDLVGELARTVDLARYNFSQLPDMSVLSEQGPLRLRFEGKTRSIFEAMMKMITHDSEQVRTQASGLKDAITRQNEAITLISSRVEAVLHNVEKRGLDGDQQIKHVVHSLINSAQSLKNAQEHSTDQLNRIVPYLQERAQGMSEIVHIAGKQISQVLQSLTVTEGSFKSSAEQSDIAIKKLSTTADDLGGRLFGAINLLQASGKVLSETTDKIQSRLNEAIAKLEQNVNATGFPMPALAEALQEPAESTDEFALAPRLETVLHAFENAQQRLEKRIIEQTATAQAQIELLSTQSSGLLSQTVTMTQTLSSAADNLRDERGRLDQMMENISSKLEALSLQLGEQSSHSSGGDIDVSTAPMTELAHQIADIASQITLLGHAAKEEPLYNTLSDKILGELTHGFGTTNQTINHLQNQLAQLTQHMNSTPSDNTASLVAQHFDISTQLLKQTRDDIARLSEMIAQSENIPSTSFNQDAQQQMAKHLDANTQLLQQTRNDITALSGMIAHIETTPSRHLIEDVQQRWFQMAGQIEATRSDLMQAIIQQVDRIEARMTTSPTPATPLVTSEGDTQKQIEQQTHILSELVATLGVLDAHMQQLKTEVRAVRH